MAKYCEQQQRLLEMEQSSIHYDNSRFLQEDSLVGTDSCSFPASPLPSFLEIIDNSGKKTETLPRVVPQQFTPDQTTFINPRNTYQQLNQMKGHIVKELSNSLDKNRVLSTFYPKRNINVFRKSQGSRASGAASTSLASPFYEKLRQKLEPMESPPLRTQYLIGKKLPRQLRFPSVSDMNKKLALQLKDAPRPILSGMLALQPKNPSVTKKTLDMLQIKNLLSKDMRRGFRFKFRYKQKEKSQPKEIQNTDTLVIDTSPERQPRDSPTLDEKRLKLKAFDASPVRRLRLTTAHHFQKNKDSSRKKIFRQTSIMDLHMKTDPESLVTISNKRTKSTDSKNPRRQDRVSSSLMRNDSQDQVKEIFEFSDSVQVFRLQAVKAEHRGGGNHRYSNQQLNPQSSSLSFYSKKKQKSLTQQPSKILRNKSPSPDKFQPAPLLFNHKGDIELYKYYESHVSDPVTDGIQGASVQGKAYKMLPNNRRVVFEKKHNKFLKLKL